MKKIICSMILSATAVLSASAGVDDVRLTFYTNGPDRYMDGTIVRDGEFYALVWVAEGETFQGFTADGKLVSQGEDNELVAAVPFAKDGHLAFCAKQIGAADMVRYAGGAFELVMLDTRNADGSVSAAKRADGGAWELAAVNGYQAIASVTPQAAALATALDIDSPIKIGSVSTVPQDAPQPVITDMKLRKGANGQEMVIKVKGTAAYLRYCVASVDLGGATSTPVAGSAINGDADPDQEIEIVIPATASSGFFKLMRK